MYWFKFEPISWTVLSESDGNALILCDMIIDSQQYNTGYTNQYNSCTIRAWLNDTFYNTAFSELQKSIILTTSVDNSVGSTSYGSNDYACDNTDDKVFFLSRSDARTYIVDSEKSQFKPTDYARVQGVETNVDGNAKWWLRSPALTSYYACLVTDTGGLGETMVGDTCVGVVPAIRIAL